MLRWLRAKWKFPRTMVITRAGRTYLVITIGVGLGALNTGNNLLYLVLGFLLSLIIASGVLSERCLQQLRIRRVLPETASAGQPFPIRVVQPQGVQRQVIRGQVQGGVQRRHPGVQRALRDVVEQV